MIYERYLQVIRSNNLNHLIPHDGEMFMSALESCYAHPENHTRCPGPHMCQVPLVNRKCVFAIGSYSFITAKKAMQFAILNSAQFETKSNCIS